MKSNKFLWVGILVFIVIIFICIGLQHRRIKHYRKAGELQAVELSTLKDSVLVHKSRTGELTTKLTSVEIEKGNLKRSLEFADFDIQELKQRDIAWRKVTSALRAQIAATGHVETGIKPDTFRIVDTDTVYFSKVDPWSNSHLSIFNGEIANKKLVFDYKYETGISIIPVPGRKETVINVFLTDPKAEITSANSISVKHKKKIWERPLLWSVVAFVAGAFATR